MSEALTAFLNARLDEDEARAREAADGDSGRWFMGEKWNVYRAEDIAPDADTDEHDLVAYGNVKVQSEHIARHDPARVLRDVAGKRKILAEHEAVTRLAGLTGQELGFLGRYREWVLKNLAAAWSDHPDFRPEWKLS